jgi:hypothetical protein
MVDYVLWQNHLSDSGCDDSIYEDCPSEEGVTEESSDGPSVEEQEAASEQRSTQKLCLAQNFSTKKLLI